MIKCPALHVEFILFKLSFSTERSESLEGQGGRGGVLINWKHKLQKQKRDVELEPNFFNSCMTGISFYFRFYNCLVLGKGKKLTKGKKTDLTSTKILHLLLLFNFFSPLRFNGLINEELLNTHRHNLNLKLLDLLAQDNVHKGNQASQSGWLVNAWMVTREFWGSLQCHLQLFRVKLSKPLLWYSVLTPTEPVVLLHKNISYLSLPHTKRLPHLTISAPPEGVFTGYLKCLIDVQFDQFCTRNHLKKLQQ